MTTKQLTMKELIVGDWLHRDGECENELSGDFRSSKINERWNSCGRNWLGGGRVQQPLRRKKRLARSWASALYTDNEEQEKQVMTINRVVTYVGPKQLELREFEFPKLVDPKGKKCDHGAILKIGRASCRERVLVAV